MSILIVSKIISLGLIFFSNIFLARYLDINIFGAFNFAKTLGSILIVITNVGLPILMVKDLSQDNKQQSFYYNIINTYRILVNSFCIAILAILLTFLDYEYNEKLAIFAITTSYILSNSIIGLNESLFQVNFKYKNIAVVNITNALGDVIIGFLAYYFDITINLFFLLFFIKSVIVAGYNIKIVNRDVLKIQFLLNKKYLNFLWRKIKESINIFLTTLFSLINNYFDVIFLSIIQGTVSVGLYSAGYKLFPVFNVIPTMVMKVMFPEISRADKEQGKVLLRKTLKVLNYIYLVIVVFISFNAEKVIEIIFSNKYSSSSQVLLILTYSLVGTYLLYPILSYLNATGNDKYARNIAIAMSFCNVILNCILVPRYDFVGAAWGTFFSTIFAGIISVKTLLNIHVITFKYISGIVLFIIINIIQIKFVHMYSCNNYLKTLASLFVITILIVWAERKVIISLILKEEER
ncbi:flippase [Desulforamulus ruminis]|uniref:flippase n=1 Tax=Desulforamulus ruminis TaxID=1564 RepID=UPI002357D919|nr:flippase [Desulforamulus ruminis]